MTTKLKKCSVLIIAAVLLIAMAFTGAASADASGMCGDNLNWAYYDGNTTLVITGSGDMDDYQHETSPWFGNHSAITSLKLPAGMTSIGDYAFYKCFALDTVIFEEDSQLTTIGPSAFFHCSALESITIPASVTTIGNATFRYSGLTSIAIPANVTKIDNYLFSQCSALKTVTFEEDSQLTTIGEEAFSQSGLTSIIIPANVTTIGDGAFSLCSALKTVTFEEDSQLTTIGKSAFSQSGLTSITIPASVSTIGTYAFGDCSALETVTFEEDSQLTTIGSGVFQTCGNLMSITIPASVTTIDGSAFKKSGLTSIAIPANVTKIDNYAFSQCSALKTVTFEEDSQLTTIGPAAFDECSALESITIPANVTTIGDSAFSQCSALKTVTFEIDSQLTTIDTSAFSGCSALKSITIPANVTTIGTTAFRDSGLETVTVEENSQLTSIGDYAFVEDTHLNKVILKGRFPSGVTFRDDVFESCENFMAVISDELLSTDVMDNFTVSGKKPVWYITKSVDSSLAGYDDYYLGFLNGGSMNATFVQESENDDYVLPIADNVTKAGYTFNTWLNDSKGVITKLDKSNKHSNLTWDLTQYTITYHLDGGTNATENPATYNITTPDITLQDATKSGYSFSGWYTDSSFSTKITKIPQGSSGNKDLYAKWTVNPSSSSSSHQTGYTQILQEVPTVTPTVIPTDKPVETSTILPTAKSTTQPTQSSPAPVLGILAGLGAAALVLTGMRK